MTPAPSVLTTAATRHSWWRRGALALGIGSVASLAWAAATLYANTDGSRIDKPLWDVLAWSVSRSSDAGLPRSGPLPVVREAQGVAAAQPGELSATWLGHASVLLRLDGVTLLTDPQFSPRASPVGWAGPERFTPLPYAPEALPHIDIVLLSHNHYDHLDVPSLRQLMAQPGGAPLFVVPQGVQNLLKDEGIGPVQVLGWWQHAELAGVEITGVPAHHWSARGMFDRHTTHWGGWVVRKGGRSAYYVGDTGYSADFRAIGERFPGLELALVPVGAYEPREFMKDQHVNPAEAVQIHRDVGARHSLGIHWGTFPLADESPEQTQQDVAQALTAQQLPTDALRLIAHGATWRIDPVAR